MDILKRKDFGLTDIPDLIKEIKRLREEKNYLLTLCAGPITGCMTNLDDAKKWVETNMQQALREGFRGNSRNSNKKTN